MGDAGHFLYFSDALDAPAHWKFWILYPPFFPDPPSLFCDPLFFIPVTHLYHSESEMEREVDKDWRKR
jgi:hypothetical protein